MKEDKNASQILRRGLVPQRRSVNEKDRTIEFVASDETVDRYGDVIRADGWITKTYEKNPVFLWAHDSRQPPIGRTIDIKIEKMPKPALIQTVQFADDPVADRVFKLYVGGFMNAVSVGFRPIEKKAIIDGEGVFQGYEFISQELLELSAVPIPANPNALARAVEEGVITKDEAEEEERLGAEYHEREIEREIVERASTVQSLVFSKADWTRARAVAWAKSHNFKSGVDETSSSYRMRQFDPSQCSPGSFATLTNNLPSGLSMVICTKKEASGGSEKGREEQKTLETAMREGLQEVMARVVEKNKDVDARLEKTVQKEDLAEFRSELCETVKGWISSISAGFEKAAEAISSKLEDVGEALAKRIEKVERALSSMAKDSDLKEVASRVDDHGRRLRQVAESAVRRQEVADLGARLTSQRESMEAGFKNAAKSADLESLAGKQKELGERFEALRDGAASDAELSALKAEIAESIGKILALHEKNAGAEDVAAIRTDLAEVVKRQERIEQRLDTLVEKSSAKLEDRSVCPYTDDPIAPSGTTWDAAAEMGKVTTPAGWKHMSTVIVGDAENKTSYKLPHHRGGGNYAIVPAGVRNALARLEQTSMPSTDRAGARSHLMRHQAKISAQAGIEIDVDEFSTKLAELGAAYRAVEAEDKPLADAIDKKIEQLVASAYPAEENREEPKPADPVASFLKI